MAALSDMGPWPLAYVMGIFFGCTSAALCTALINCCISSFAEGKKETVAVAPPLLSRRERAVELLGEMRRQRMEVAPGAVRGADEERESSNATSKSSAAEWGNGRGHRDDDAESSSSTNSSCWTSTSEDTDESKDDSEYERMEDLRLRMMFVVRYPVQPKMSAQEVAVLTASAGVQLVELHQRGQKDPCQTSSETDERRFVSASTSSAYAPTAEDRQRWLHWYLWWNRIGCAKITLKCPDRSTMNEVLRATEEKRLPVVGLHRSRSGSQEGVKVQKAAPSGLDEVVVMALGPAPSDVLASVTGALKLFS